MIGFLALYAFAALGEYAAFQPDDRGVKGAFVALCWPLMAVMAIRDWWAGR